MSTSRDLQQEASVGRKEYKALRATCRELKWSIDPLYFFEMHIGPRAGDDPHVAGTTARKTLSILRGLLSNDDTPAYVLTKRLSINLAFAQLLPYLGSMALQDKPRGPISARLNMRAELQRMADERKGKHMKAEDQIAVVEALSLLQAVLPKFQGVQSVEWLFCDLDRVNANPVLHEIVEAITRFPSLSSFYYKYEVDPQFDYVRPPTVCHFHLKNLTSLSFTNVFPTTDATAPFVKLISESPALSSLESVLVVKHGYSKYSIRRLFECLPGDITLPLTNLTLRGWELSDSSDMRHFAHLRSLYLGNCSLPRGVLWKSLERSNTTLVDLTVDLVDDFLVAYLQSYTGLQRFTFRRFDSMSPVVDLILRKLFEALTGHSDTLRELSLEPRERELVSRVNSNLVATMASYLGGLTSLIKLSYRPRVPYQDSETLDDLLCSLLSATENLGYLEVIYLLVDNSRDYSQLLSSVQQALMRLGDSATAAFQNVIPIEIYEYIISFIDHKPTLKSCSLTCRAWLQTSWKTLFWHSVLLIHRRNIHSILEIIERDAHFPTIIRFIQGLLLEQGGSNRLPILTGAAEDDSHLADEDFGAFQFDDLLPRLVGFESTQRLRLGWVRGDTGVSTSRALRDNFGQITALELNSVILSSSAQFFEILAGLPMLKSLTLVGFKFNAGRPAEDARTDTGMAMNATPRPPPRLEELYCNVTEDISEFIFSWILFHHLISIRILAAGLFNQQSNTRISRFLEQSGLALEEVKIWDAYTAAGFDLSPCTNIRTLRMGWIHLSSSSPPNSENFVTDILKTATSPYIQEITVVLQILVSNTPGVEGDLDAFDWGGLVGVLQRPQFKNLRKFCFSVSSHIPVVKRALFKYLRPVALAGKLPFEIEGVFQVVPWSRAEYGGQWMMDVILYWSDKPKRELSLDIKTFNNNTSASVLQSLPPEMPIALIVGASRGLGLELAKNLHGRDGYNVFATTRSLDTHIRPEQLPNEINVIPNIDLTKEDAGAQIVSYLRGDLGLGNASDEQLDLVIVNAGVFKADTLAEPQYDNLVEMFKVVAIAPLMIASHLTRANLLASPSKFILISSEGGSIALRTRQEGAGNYGHHASKAALNMMGKLLSNELNEKQITVGLIHPGFMRTDMTKNVGFDQFYDSGGAVEPSQAAETTIEFVLNELPHDLTGSFWAPRGPRLRSKLIPFLLRMRRDIGEAERVLVPVMGKNLPTPLPIPW
ncbi:hypothetical protein D9757_003887 [Collybiopsis confluens]|uniref:Uncharacterized protein n=1 Tax=Collybiopsis confluens TaxID=2823264 RepID=A0A8H5HV77_9AGAR|nr:hypothetical protein D9757_003887 [Collybiopsis confluens]